jgi:quercetin dioxygenase-like cupin family protein
MAADYPLLVKDASRASAIIAGPTMAHGALRETEGEAIMISVRRILAMAATVVALGCSGAFAAEQEAVAFSTMLPNVPGQRLTAVVVSYAPGGTSHAHRHAGSVYAYVLSGSIRSENSATGAARVYKAGESFFEPPGSTHLISENASKTEPASLLAVFVAEDGATLTTPAH